MRTALIIGVSGQDGAYLARLLLEKGYAVHGTSRDHEHARLDNLSLLDIRESVHLHTLTLSDFRSVLAILQALRPDEIYNLGGQTSVGRSFLFPVETFESISVGTVNILECLRLIPRDTRFFNAGSSECFGNCLEPAHEGTRFRPRSPYAIAKAASHHAVANYREGYGLYACTGMLFNHESPLRPARFVTQKIVAAAARISRGARETLPLGNLAVARDWGWAPDYVDAMWRMLQQSDPRDYVIATGEVHRLHEFVAEAFATVGLDWRDHVVNDPTLLRPTDIDVSVGDPSQAERMLDWRATTRFRGVVRSLMDAALRGDPTAGRGRATGERSQAAQTVRDQSASNGDREAGNASCLPSNWPVSGRAANAS